MVCVLVANSRTRFLWIEIQCSTNAFIMAHEHMSRTEADRYVSISLPAGECRTHQLLTRSRWWCWQPMLASYRIARIHMNRATVSQWDWNERQISSVNIWVCIVSRRLCAGAGAGMFLCLHVFIWRKVKSAHFVLQQLLSMCVCVLRLNTNERSIRLRWH